MTPPLAFVLAVLAMELTPGPNMAYLAIVSLQTGWRGGLAAVAGVTVGLLVYLLMATAGLAELTARWPWIYDILKWGGVAYLSWLAWDGWRGERAAVAPVGGRGFGQLFRRGLVANLLNPKAALLYLVLLPTFMSPTGNQSAQVLGLGLFHIAVSIVVHLTIVASGGRMRDLIVNGDAGRVTFLRRALAVTLALVAAWVALSPR